MESCMRLLLYRNCQMLSMFSFEPSNGVSSLPCWDLEALKGLWCLRVWKRIKCICSSSGSSLFLWMFIFTMPRPVVWLWKWGSKYLKRGNQMLRRLARDTHEPSSYVSSSVSFGIYSQLACYCRQWQSKLPNLVNPISYTAWLGNHALTLKSNSAKYYFGEKSSFMHTFLKFSFTFNALSVFKKVNLNVLQHCHDLY